MKLARSFQFFAAALAAFHFAACSGLTVTHVQPGKSAAALLAERNNPQEVPAAPVPPVKSRIAGAPLQFPPDSLPPLPSGDVGIPSANGSGGGVADTYSRGTFAMQAGQNEEAITALEQTVKLDPDFTDAWGKLAILYQKTGNSVKAMEAFKKAKRLGDANGGTVSRDSVGGLQLQ